MQSRGVDAVLEPQTGVKNPCPALTLARNVAAETGHFPAMPWERTAPDAAAAPCCMRPAALCAGGAFHPFVVAGRLGRPVRGSGGSALAGSAGLGGRPPRPSSARYFPPGAPSRAGPIRSARRSRPAPSMRHVSAGGRPRPHAPRQAPRPPRSRRCIWRPALP